MIKVYKGHIPKISEDVFVAKESVIIGNIEIGEKSSVWYGAILRGDENRIRIGARSNIQDGVVIHVGHEHETLIGEGVTVGHRAIIHGARIDDYTLIGMGSTILDGAKIGKNCIIGANSLVTANTVIEDGMLVLGAPARVIKKLTKEQIEGLYDSANYYVKLAESYKADYIDEV